MSTATKFALIASISASFLSAQTQPDLSAPSSALLEFQRICRDAGDRLWGKPLCGRLLLVDPGSKTTLATMPDPDRKFAEKNRLFIGTLPPDILIANTSVQWGNQEWAMVSLPLPTDEFLRLRLLVHESFHRLQSELGLRASDAPSAHLDTETGRLWLRLELRALSQALRLDGDAARIAAKDALLFRTARQHLNPGAELRESALEIQEGLAEYTGTVIALESSGETLARVARVTENFEDQVTLARSFAYATGPALVLLLDRYGDASWRKKLKNDSNLAFLLGQALGFRYGQDLLPNAESRADRYGFRAVASDERSRVQRTQALQAGFRSRFLDGPILEFPKTEELRRSFNPNNLISLGESGTVYPTGTFVSRWGRLQIDDVGALLSPDNQSLRVSAPNNLQARPLLGPGWSLELAPGWSIQAGSKAGNFVVRPD